MTRKKSIVIIFLTLFLSLLYLIIHINDFIFLRNSNYSDIAITHYPNLLFIQNTISKYSQLPLWSNLIQSGYPFAANPLSGIWYLFGWIAVLFPLPIGININLILHISLAFFGLFMFLREEGRSYPGSIFGALAFAFSTKIFAHLGAGHLTLVYSVSWTPWLLYFTKKFSLSPSWYKKLTPGLILGLILTSDPRWALPSGILWLTYVIFEFKNLRKIISISMNAFCIGLTSSAGIWIPLIQYIPLSTRSVLTIQEKLIYSLDFQNLIGLFVPEFGGFAEWILYPGAIAVLLFVLGLFLFKENKKIRIWYFVAFVTLVLSFGKNFPLISIVFSMPIFSLLRVPTRFILIFILALSIIISFVLDYLIIHEKDYKFDRIFFISPILFFIIFLTIGVVIVTGQISTNIIWASILFIISFILIAIVYHRKSNRQTYYLFFIGLLFIDLVGINIQSFKFKTPSEILDISPGLKNLLNELPEFARIYTPSYSITQEQAAFWQVNQVNGIDPMQLSKYVNYFSMASGIPIEEYTVTLPPFKSSDPKNDNKKYCPDVNLLSKLSVKYIISNFQFLKCEKLDQYQMIDGLFVYQINEIISPAHFEESYSEIELKEYTPNFISLSTKNGGNLILNEISYPGWVTIVDGQRVKNESYGIFRSIKLSDEPHNIEFKFKPLSVFIGGIIQVLSMLFYLIITIRKV